MGWRRRLFHRQLCGGTRGALPSTALAAQRGLCLERSCEAIDELLVLVGGRREAWREEDGRQRSLAPRETCKGPSCQGRRVSTNTTLQIFMLGEKKKKNHHTTKPTTLLCHSAGQIQTLCEMTTLIAKADYRNTAAGLVPAACAAASCSGVFCCLQRGRAPLE